MSKDKVSTTAASRTPRERLKADFGHGWNAGRVTIGYLKEGETKVDILKKSHKKHGSLTHWFFYCVEVARRHPDGQKSKHEVIKWVHLCSDFRERHCEDYGYCKHCDVAINKQLKMLARLRCLGGGLAI